MGLFSKLFGKKKDEQTVPLKSGEEKKDIKDEHEEKHHSKLHDSLQQWSNDNARDIEEDDSTPLRSGL